MVLLYGIKRTFSTAPQPPIFSVYFIISDFGRWQKAVCPAVAMAVMIEYV